MSIRRVVFAVWRAVWRYVASWTASRVTYSGGGVGDSSIWTGVFTRRTHRESRLWIWSSLHRVFKVPLPQNGGGSGRVGIFFRPSVSFLRLGVDGSMRMDWDNGVVRPIAFDWLGQKYRRYRLADPPAEDAMAGSLRRWGQLSPVVACVRDEELELLDGFKRLAAAQQVAGLTSLSVRVLAVDERMAKAAILGLNHAHHGARELEEAWIVQALVRDDGLTQVEAAQLLGKHKSWVCRRLALLEKLSPSVKDDLRLGLLGPTLARQLVRLPVGNQEAVLALTRRESLTAREVSGVIDLLQGAGEEQAAFVLTRPREALRQTQGMPTALRDPRLSRAGNWLVRQLTQASESLVRLEHWLRTPGQRELTARDREVVEPVLMRLGDEASLVAELVLGPTVALDRRLP